MRVSLRLFTILSCLTIAGLLCSDAQAGAARPGGAGGGRAAGGAGGGGAAQPVGFGGSGGGGAGGGGAMFTLGPEKFGLVNVLPEKTSQVRVACVCLQHGAPDPAPQIPYEIMPIEKYTTDATLQELIKAFGRGEMLQRSAQAATWHVANKMTWEELAQKQIKHINRPAESYFAATEIATAMQYSAEAEKLAKNRPAESGNASITSGNDIVNSAPGAKTLPVAPVADKKEADKKEKVADKTVVTVGLFEAIEKGQVEAKFIPANDHEAKLLITNKTKESLVVRVPDGMAGKPVLPK